MAEVQQLRRGNIYEEEGQLWRVLEHQHIKVARGRRKTLSPGPAVVGRECADYAHRHSNRDFARPAATQLWRGLVIEPTGCNVGQYRRK